MRYQYICILLIVAAAAAATMWFKAESFKRADGYKQLISGDVGLSSIEFSGQRRSIKTEDQTIIKDFKEAFKGCNKPSRASGIYYNVKFAFKTGIEIKTDVYLYTDGSGFSMADYSRLSAGDPLYVNVEFQGGANKRTQKLIEFLLDK